MSRTSEPDLSLRRVERDSAVICAAAALVALALMRGRPDGAVGVLAGGVLMAFSYRAIKGGVDAIFGRTPASPDQRASAPVSRRAVARAAIRFIGRYGVLAVAAWAVLVPLHAHPLGLFAGVTAPVLAIGIEAMRLVRAARR